MVKIVGKLNIESLVKPKVKKPQKTYQYYCNEIFDDFGKRNRHFTYWTSAFGEFINKRSNDSITNNQLKIIMKCIDKFLSRIDLKKDRKAIEFINTIYSTMLKVITPEKFIKGKMSAYLYRKLISDSINISKRPVAGKGIDYRRILSRWLALSRMSSKVDSHIKAPIHWGTEDQLGYVTTLEAINKNFDAVKRNYSITNNSYGYAYKDNFLLDKARKDLSIGRHVLVKMLVDDIKSAMKSPRKNLDKIKGYIEIARDYAVKLRDEQCMQFINDINTLEADFYKSLQ